MTEVIDPTFYRTPGDAIAAFHGLHASPLPRTHTAATMPPSSPRSPCTRRAEGEPFAAATHQGHSPRPADGRAL